MDALATSYLVSTELPLAVILSLFFFCPLLSYVSIKNFFRSQIPGYAAGSSTLGCWAQWKRGLQQYLQRKRFISFACNFCLSEKNQQASKRQSRYKQFNYASCKVKVNLSYAEICESRRTYLLESASQGHEIWGFSIFSVSSFKVINSDKYLWYVTRNNIFSSKVNKFMIDYYVKSLWTGKLLTVYRKIFILNFLIHKIVCIYTIMKEGKRSSFFFFSFLFCSSITDGHRKKKKESCHFI